MPANACGKRREGVSKVSLASDEQYSYDSARRVTGKACRSYVGGGTFANERDKGGFSRFRDDHLARAWV